MLWELRNNKIFGNMEMSCVEIWGGGEAQRLFVDIGHYAFCNNVLILIFVGLGCLVVCWSIPFLLGWFFLHVIVHAYIYLSGNSFSY